MLRRERELRQQTEDAYRTPSGSYTAMVRTLAETCEVKDAYTRGHLDRTYRYAQMLTARVAPEYAERAEIGYGFLLHDIGKVGIPEHVLDKPGALSKDD